MILPTRSPRSHLFDAGPLGVDGAAPGHDPWAAYPQEGAAREAFGEPVSEAVAPPKPSPRLLQAASALLRALAAIQCADQPPAEGLQALHDGLAREVVEFCRACDRAGIRHEHMLATRYALCTALDEALSCKPWAGGEQGSVGPWSRYALLQEFHQEGEGGKAVFLLIARLAAQPQQHREVLEVMLRILALGFMGDYRRRTDGQRELDGLRQHLLALLGGDVVAVDPAPHARRLEAHTPVRGWRPPWWMVPAAVVLLALLASARIWTSNLEAPSRQLRESLLGLGASIETALRPPAPGAAAPARLATAADPSDLQAWLSAPVRAGQLEVAREGDAWRIRFAGDSMFETGSSTLNPQLLPVLRQVADALRVRPGRVLITGHTDDTPGGREGEASNRALSLRRAAAVAAQLQRLGVEASRLSVQGLGSADPIGDNATAEGRVRNRRVDIVLGGSPDR
ncbi:MAG: type IVB secretion system protein IcmH/DotU [Betaproteobacteria bacterium]|nr:type IVB secretion system protein IcmH/DotU [Betaproteobacteria bacterium]